MTEIDKKTFQEVVKTHIEFIDDSNKLLTEDSVELFKVIIDINREYREQLEMLSIESCKNCNFDKECRHKSMMPEGQKICKYYILIK